MVPEGWTETRLGEIVIHRKGYAFDSKDYDQAGRRIIRISDTTRDGIGNERVVCVPHEVAKDLETYALDTGDVLLSTVGSRPHLLDSMVGKVVRVPEGVKGALLNQNLVRLDPISRDINREHLFAVLKDKRFIYYISTLVRGNANQVSITLAELFQYKFSLPPLPEQKKIAEILGTWDRAIEVAEKQLKNAEAQKRALMQHLLAGTHRLKGFEDSEWKTVKLGDVCEFLDGMRKPIKAADRATMQGQNPYYGATGIIDWVDAFIFDEPLLLLGEDGENILSRNLPHVFRIEGKSWVNNHAHVLRPKSEVSHAFVCEFLESLDYRKYNSGSAQPKLNKKVCESIPVLLPCFEEQKAIGAILEISDQQVHNCKAKLNHLRTEKRALMQQLLTGKKRVKVEEAA